MQQSGGSGSETFITGGTQHGYWSDSGPTNCEYAVSSASNVFAGLSSALNPQNMWFGANYQQYNPNGKVQGVGAMETPVDPRLPDTIDPSPVPTWP